MRISSVLRSLLPLTAVWSVSNGQKLVWSEEFNGASLDNGRWTIETGTGVNGDFGTGQLDRATDRAANLQIVTGLQGADGGALAVTTTKEHYIDREYTSGRINSAGKGTVGPGQKIAARVWARDVKYGGQGFAFWLMPDEVPAGQSSIMWPQGGEVDIMEYVGAIPNYNLGTVHYAWYWENNTYVDWNHGHLGGYYSYADKQGPNGADPGYGNYPPSPTDQNTGSYSWHTYGLNWYKDRMEYTIDDNVYHVHYLKDGAAYPPADGQDKSSQQVVNGKRTMVSEYSNHFDEWHPFEHKFYVILSAGVGGASYTYGGPIASNAVFPCSVFVDWVRVYELTDSSSTTPTPTTTSTTAPPAGTCSATLSTNVNFVGNDVGTAAASSASGCCTACKSVSGAKAFTFMGGTCYCKSSKVSTSIQSGVTSGDLDSGASTTPTPTTTTSAPGTCTLSVDTDFTGSDAGAVTSTTASGCCTACKSVSGATAFSFMGNTCYCKSSKGSAVAKAGVTSGVFA